MKKYLFLMVLSAVCMSFNQTLPAAYAGIPETINYQGYLADSDGDPIEDSVLSMTFHLYDTETGGTSLWSEVQSVDITDGIFSVILGASTPLDLDFSTQYWLGVTVGSDSEMTPRRELTGTVYSFRSKIAESVIDDAVGTSGLADGAVTAAKIGISCTSGQVLKYDGTGWVCAAETDTLGNLTTCTNGQVVKWNETTSAWECADDTDTNTDVLAGLTCADDQIAKWNSTSSAWKCQSDDTADPGTDTLAALSCNDGEIAKWNKTSDRWECQDDDGTVYATLSCTGTTTTITGSAVYFNDTSDATKFTFDTSTGVADATAWNTSSDRNLKENFEAVDTLEVLEKLAGIPMDTWNFKTQDDTVRHMGPMAQDFYAAFGLGKGETTIATVDADGVALAAIQGLYDMLQEQRALIEEQRSLIERQQSAIDDLNARLANE
jgi:hypothetical protein